MAEAFAISIMLAGVIVAVLFLDFILSAVDEAIDETLFGDQPHLSDATVSQFQAGGMELGAEANRRGTDKHSTSSVSHSERKGV